MHGTPKLAQELVDRAIALKRGGLSNGDIICALGIHESTFYRWIGDPKNKPQRELSEGLKQEETAFKQTLLTTIRAAALARNQYWTAAAWLLERKYPDKYGKADRRRDERLVHIARHRARDARQPGRERRGGASVLQRAARLGLPEADVGDRGAGAGEVVPRAHLPPWNSPTCRPGSASCSEARLAVRDGARKVDPTWRTGSRCGE